MDGALVLHKEEELTIQKADDDSDDHTDRLSVLPAEQKRKRQSKQLKASFFKLILHLFKLIKVLITLIFARCVSDSIRRDKTR